MALDHDSNVMMFDEPRQKDEVLENHVNSQEEKAAVAMSIQVPSDVLNESNKQRSHAVHGQLGSSLRDLEEQMEDNGTKRKQKVR